MASLSRIKMRMKQKAEEEARQRKEAPPDDPTKTTMEKRATRTRAKEE